MLEMITVSTYNTKVARVLTRPWTSSGSGRARMGVSRTRSSVLDALTCVHQLHMVTGANGHTPLPRTESQFSSKKEEKKNPLCVVFVEAEHGRTTTNHLALNIQQISTKIKLLLLLFFLLFTFFFFLVCVLFSRSFFLFFFC